MHVGWGPFEQTSAPPGKQRVAAEQHRTEIRILLLGDHKGDVGGGVGGHVQNLQRSAEHGHLIAVADGDGLKGNARSIRSSSYHGRIGPSLQQARGSTDVIGVVMRLQHRTQLQLPLLKPVDDWFGHSRIHHNGLIAPHPDPYDVVLQYRQGMEGGLHR